MRRVACIVPIALLASMLAAVAADAPVMPRFQDYYFAFLRKGPQWSGAKTPRGDSIQAGHLANIKRMHEAGLLVAAGPFERGQDRRGVFVFRADSIDAIRRLVAQDPAVEAGQLQMDLYRWTAPAGIGELYTQRSKQPGFRDSMYSLQLAVLRCGPEFEGFSDEATMKDVTAHGTRLMGLFNAGSVATGGQFHPGSGPDTTLVGVLVFRGDTTATRALVRDDPAVIGKRFSVEWEKWWIAWGTLPGDTL